MTTTLPRGNHETALVEVIQDIVWQLNRGDLASGLAIAEAAIHDEQPAQALLRGTS